MASRTWLAVVLGCAVWFAYIKWFAPMPPPPTPQPGQAQVQVDAKSPITQPAGGVFATITQAKTIPGFSDLKQEVQFSPTGGKIASVTLPEYRQTIKKDSAPITTINTTENNQALATYFSNAELAAFSDAEYTAQKKGDAEVFVAKRGDVLIQKEFRRGATPFSLLQTITIESKDPKKDLGYLMVPVGGSDLKHDLNVPVQSWEVVWDQNEKVNRVYIDAVTETPEVHQGNTRWLAFGNRYFATALVNKSEINPDVVVAAEGTFKGGYLRFPIRFKDGKNSATYQLEIYSGPKISEQLKTVPGLITLIDYGMFSSLAFYLLKMLQFFYHYVHNYGVAIIILTIAVRLALYPLSLKSYRSMKAMQKLTPQIQSIKEKYKDDMQRQQQEQMALFKAHGVNPMGGCLPMLVQLPVFVALYAVLGNSIELFHAPFFGWVQDLSTKDPYYVYPILMGIAMFVQQKMTPSVGMDPVQQKMMLLMPVVFSFIMINLPSGLTMYIFVSTLLGVLQQLAMRDPVAPQVPAAAK